MSKNPGKWNFLLVIILGLFVILNTVFRGYIEDPHPVQPTLYAIIFRLVNQFICLVLIPTIYTIGCVEIARSKARSYGYGLIVGILSVFVFTKAAMISVNTLSETMIWVFSTAFVFLLFFLLLNLKSKNVNEFRISKTIYLFGLMAAFMLVNALVISNKLYDWVYYIRGLSEFNITL